MQHVLTGKDRALELNSHDASSDFARRQQSELSRLREDVNRIASTLARMAQAKSSGASPTSAADDPQLLAETVRSVIRARRLRTRYFPPDLFSDPAWDMLLELLQAEISDIRISISSLCIGASVPASTALRWLNQMSKQGLFIRCSDPEDGRRAFVELAPKTSQALRSYFAEVGSMSVI